MRSPLNYPLGPGAEAFTIGKDSVLPCPVVTGHQVHGAKIAVVDSPGITREDLEGYDVFLTRTPGVAVGVRTADCVPVLLYDPGKRIVAAIHAGWKGSVQRITQKAVMKMVNDFGSNAADIRAAFGPAIGAESFQVGEEVVGYFKAQGFPLDDIWFFNKGMGESPMYHGHHIDLMKANAWLLEQSGVAREHIFISDIDTYTDPAFYSARREGIGTGRNISAIRLV